MSVAIRSFLTAGAALIGAGVVTAAQVVPAERAANMRLVQSAVELAAAVSTGDGQPCTGYHTSNCDIWATPTYTPVAAQPGSAANIPANLVNAVLNIPRAWIDGMNDFSYALEVTGNWWVYSPTNVLGFDPADPPKVTALTNWMIPFPALSNPLGEHTAWSARANLPMNASCTGTVGPACSDIGPIFSKMFLAPAWTLAAGYQYPELDNPVSDAEAALGEEIPGSVGKQVPWAGAYVKLDPMDPLTSVMNYLQADPATNAPKPLTGDEITGAFKRFANALTLAFNPIVPKSYLLKGWPYTILTPVFLPFVPVVCPTCNPENPGGPPVSPAAAVPSTTLVGDVATADLAPADDASTDDAAAVAAEVAPAEPRAGTRKVGSARAAAAQLRADVGEDAPVTEPGTAATTDTAAQATVDAATETAAIESLDTESLETEALETEAPDTESLETEGPDTESLDTDAAESDIAEAAAETSPADTADAPEPKTTGGKHRKADDSADASAAGDTGSAGSAQ